ncbi:hypothetical protein KXQ82_19410 [Mucilaginibacter sp. HMF5004]|uniref:MG2 domain-containing protein n=1 Tax=Mucilaginibacter rivuli TaxID=2857527 RepID=UPI001C5F5923|nr:MG2 domain-containing protein [Mucilaginibacter rivuli]MBW4891901.1 hypothetical protein [Mucilaginibacter rivuli]
MRLTKSYLLFAMLLCCGKILYAQNKPAPFKLFFEKVYLHTDRDLYSQGDTIWYKAYLINAQNNQPINLSGNLYVELIQQDSSLILNREIIRMDIGVGNGDFSLSDSIPSGKYKLRAYTNWMRNFGDNFIFEKELTVINTEFKTAAPAVVKQATKGGKIQKQTAEKPVVINNPVLRFYPESGSLVEGVSAIIAVKAEDRMGKGIPASGAVLNTAGDTVAHFRCDMLGTGLFAILPVQGQQYHAVATSNIKKEFTADLPRPLIKGFALRVNHTDSALTVIISCNDAQLADARGKTLTLSGKHDGKTYFSKSLQITENQILIKISNEIFPEGITAITLTDDQNKPHCERLVYMHHNAPAVTIKADKAVYTSKEKVTLHINTNNEKANLSMAVVDAGVTPVEDENIESYLMLKSELKGNIEHPNRYFDTTNINRGKQLDLLLMTQGWRDFIWRRLADTAIRISYKAEDGIDITGKVKNENSNSPLPGLNITMFASGNKGPKLLAATTDDKGDFAFSNLLYYGEAPVKLSAVNIKGEKKGTFFMDTLSTLPLPNQAAVNLVNAPADSAKGELAAVIKRQSALKTARLNSSKQLKEVKIRSSKFVMVKNGTPFTTWGADQTFDITSKDYQFKTLEWFVLQNVKGALQSPSDSITGIVIPGEDTVSYLGASLNGTPNILYRSKSVKLPPQFFVNGIDYSTDDAVEAEVYRSTYYPLPIDKFKRIVIKHVVGNLINARNPAAQQIMVDRYFIYITLKEDAMAGYNPGTLRPIINGYYNSRTFYKPLYDSIKDLNKPDLRTTIHWEPNINTDEKGNATISFYNADPKTTVRVIVQGVKTSGGPIVGSTIYDVK